MVYDCIIIGAGSVGCAAARELSKYKLKVLVLEKGHDICSGASKANTGMIHAGYDPVPGTREAEFNAPGARMMFDLCDELDVPYQKSGMTIFASDEKGLAELEKLQGYARKNGVHVEIVTPPRLYELQPRMGEAVKALLWVPDGAVTNPFTVTFALAENAHANGVEFLVDAEVTDIRRTDGLPEDGGERTDLTWQVTAGGRIYETKTIINSAGGHSDKINNMVSDHKFHIIPRFGAHVILDRKWSSGLTTTLMETPHDLPGGGHTKGMAIAPSIGGTMLLGCDAVEVEDPDTTDVPAASIKQIVDYFKEAWPLLPLGSDGSPFPEEAIIGFFGGCRPHADTNDFVIGEAEDAPGFINAGGTESPAFTSCPAIGAHVAGLVRKKLEPGKNEQFNPYRTAKPAFRDMSDAEKRAAIAEDPDYARIVCRCETVTEAEIRDAIRRPLGARSIAGVKLRTRAGMGRCQGGFCSPRVLEILCEELGLGPLEVTQCGGESQVLACRSGQVKAGQSCSGIRSSEDAAEWSDDAAERSDDAAEPSDDAAEPADDRTKGKSGGLETR